MVNSLFMNVAFLSSYGLNSNKANVQTVTGNILRLHIYIYIYTQSKAISSAHMD